MIDTEIDLAPILSYDNITISVLFAIVIVQWGVILKLLSSILSMRGVLEKLSNMIAIRNERLHKHD